MTIRIIPVLATCALYLIAPGLHADETGKREYAVMLSGNVIGERIAEPLGENEWRYEYRFQDRGRGPDLVTHLRTDEKGLPLEIRTTGVAYFKNAVDERFVVRDGVAEWKNANEQGTARAAGVYLSIDGAEGVEPLLHALLMDDDGRINVLPAGEARLGQVLTHALADGERKRKLALYAIEGLGFSPSFVWADENGHVFYDGWVIRKGWESHARALDEISTQAKAQRLGELARSLARSTGEPLLVRNARVFDTTTRSAREGLDVLVRDGRIAAVGAKLDVPANAHVIDADGRFLMPGLWDMHVHNFGGDAVGLQHLANGVTTVRDLAADIDTLVDLRKRWHAGETLGPRVVMAGFIDGPGPYAGPTRVLVDDEAQARAAVKRYAELGYEQIKLYNSLRKELVPAIVDEARKHGLRVGGHMPLHMLAEEGVRLGYDEIHHINHLFLNFMDPKIDNRTPARFVEVAKHGAELDLASAPVRDFIALLVEHDVTVDPTLALFEADWVSRPGEIVRPMLPVANRLPPMTRRSSLWSGLPIPDGFDARYRESFQRSREFVKRLHDAGVRIVPGTDFMAGFALHRELEIYSEAGIANADVLYLATAGAATVAGHDKDTGRIAPGYRADFILVDGDPLASMTDIRKTHAVIRDGRLYYAADLQSALGMSPGESGTASAP